MRFNAPVAQYMEMSKLFMGRTIPTIHSCEQQVIPMDGFNFSFPPPRIHPLKPQPKQTMG